LPSETSASLAPPPRGMDEAAIAFGLRHRLLPVGEVELSKVRVTSMLL